MFICTSLQIRFCLVVAHCSSDSWYIGKVFKTEEILHKFFHMTKLVKALHIINLHSTIYYKLDKIFYLILIWWCKVSSKWNKKNLPWFYPLVRIFCSYALHKFTPAQNFSRTSVTSYLYSSASSLIFMGMKLWVRHYLNPFFTDFKLFRNSPLKLSERVRRLTTEPACCYFLTQS